MDRTRKKDGGGFLQRIGRAAQDSFCRGVGGRMPAYDIFTLALALMVSRCHIIFGAYPLGIAMISILPRSVWPAVLGAVIGSLTLGKSGVVYALICIIVAFLRLIISGTGRGEEGERLFGERLLLKLSSAVIGGFIAAAYEILLGGFTLVGVCYGVSMILLPPTIAFAVSGLFEAGVTPNALILGTSEIFSLRRREAGDKFPILFFECSLLFTIFILSLSFEEYELFGISLGYIYSALITLFAARRFGAVRGAAVGFVSSVGLSSVYSVGFALAGLVAGALSQLKIIYSVIGGALAVGIWGAYSGGAVGILSLFPEYAIAGAIALPLFKGARLEARPEEVMQSEGELDEMVSAMALSYKSRYTGALDTLEGSFSSISTLLRRVRRDEDTVTYGEAKRLVIECITRYFDRENPNMPGAQEARSKFFECVDNVSTILYKTKKITPECFNTPPHLSVMAKEISDSICRAVAILTEERYREKSRDSGAEDFEYISKLINEARLGDESEKAANETLTGEVKKILEESGIPRFSVTVYGRRSPHLIIAAEDPTGALITRDTLHKSIEGALGLKLVTPDYYRKGDMALMECGVRPMRSVTTGGALTEGQGGEVSGDSAISFDTREKRHFTIISDGEGRGAEARRTSDFVTEFLARALEFGAGCESALGLVNSTLKHRPDMSSATVDIFSLDLLSGEAMFYKCGAAPSYIKRGSSLFRIRSRTSPIGPVPTLDAERIRVECMPGDYVIMFSDGISQDGEDAPWLIEFLAKPIPKAATPDSIAESILTLAKGRSLSGDDMTIRVIKIEEK